MHPPISTVAKKLAVLGYLEGAAGAAARMPGGAVGAPACLYGGKGANTARELQ